MSNNGKLPKGPVIAGLLFLLLTLPIAIYFVTQQQQLADLRKRAVYPEGGNYCYHAAGTSCPEGFSWQAHYYTAENPEDDLGPVCCPLSPSATVCFPGTAAKSYTDTEVRCSSDCGQYGGYKCNAAGTAFSTSCSYGLHACGYSQPGSCTTAQDCINLGYGSGVYCNDDNTCVGPSGRWFIGCGKNGARSDDADACQNCYTGANDPALNGCFDETTSCGQKDVCRTAPTPTELAALVTTQPPTDNTPTNTPINTPTNTVTGTPIDTPTNTPTGTLTQTPTYTPTHTPTGTPGPTSTPTPSPTPAPGCNSPCVINTDCPSVYVCWEGFCRNASCVENSNCVCAGATPTPTTPATPNVPIAGAGPTVLGVSVIGGGLLLLLLGLLL